MSTEPDLTATENLTSGGQATLEVLEFVKNTPGAENIKGIKELVALAKQGAPEEETDEDGNVIKKAHTKTTHKPAAKKTATAKSTSPLFANAKEKDEDTDVVEFEEGSDVSEYIKNTFGVEKPSEFFKQTSEWKGMAEKAEAAIAEKEQFTKFFQGLPPELFSILEAYDKGGDWKKTASGALAAGIDFSKDFDSQDKMAVLNKYMPDTYTKDDLDDIENNPGLKKALLAAKSLFNTDKEQLALSKESVQQSTIQENESRKESAKTSVAELKKAFPLLSKTAIETVNKHMTNGTYKNLFLTEKGAFTKDAATRIAMALYGEQTIREAYDDGKKKGQEKEVETIVGRLDNKPEIRKTGDSDKESPLKKLPTNVLSMISDFGNNNKNKLSARAAT